MRRTLLMHDGMRRMPAGAKMSMASINAEPMMPNVVVTPLATMVSTKASLGVIRVMAFSGVWWKLETITKR
jgi:hypothetical protein